MTTFIVASFNSIESPIDIVVNWTVIKKVYGHFNPVPNVRLHISLGLSRPILEDYMINWGQPKNLWPFYVH